ncbi:ribonuclease H-like domain-containing protein [Tanacetum coccineum]
MKRYDDRISDPVSDSTFYRSLACALEYLTFTRPDISYDVQQVCLCTHAPRKPHLAALKRIIRYVRGTLDHGLQLHVSTTTQLTAYTDADWADSGQVRVLHVSSRSQYADIFTKGLPSALFLEFRSSLNVRRPPVLIVGEY